MVELIKILEGILIDKVNRTKLVSEFQQSIWNPEDGDELLSEEVDEILSDLAYDLDFYEPNPEWRKEHPSFYGEEKLERILIAALEKLKDL